LAWSLMPGDEGRDVLGRRRRFEENIIRSEKHREVTYEKSGPASGGFLHA